MVWKSREAINFDYELHQQPLLQTTVECFFGIVLYNYVHRSSMYASLSPFGWLIHNAPTEGGENSLPNQSKCCTVTVNTSAKGAMTNKQCNQFRPLN